MNEKSSSTLSSDINNSGSSSSHHEYDAETAVWRVFSIIRSMNGWRVTPKRIKDYIRSPKSSGYVHITFQYREVLLYFISFLYDKIIVGIGVCMRL